jgi:D-alanyl-D-alanine endopeptidase (penicillin-binding protein 7)
MKFILYIVLMLSSQVALAGTTTPSYAIWNVDTGHLLSSNNTDSIRSQASITKLMTVLVVLEMGLDLNQTVTVTGLESSRRLRRGAVVTRGELVDLSLVGSDNLASRTLSETSGITYEQFIERMNATAVAIGMKNTVYADSTGLLNSNVSTLSDIKTLIQRTEQYPTFRQNAMKKDTTVVVWFKNKFRQVTANNTNHFAGQLDLISAKTGTTNAAGRCLTMMFSDNGQRYVLVVMGARSSEQRVKMVTKLVDLIR